MRRVGNTRRRPEALFVARARLYSQDFGVEKPILGRGLGKLMSGSDGEKSQTICCLRSKRSAPA